MATGGRLRDSDVPDIYSCAVCLEHLLDRNPRFLSCHHSFCQQCIQRLTNNDHVSCPICRAVTAVPNNDITNLQMNFQLVQIMEREKELKEGKQTHFSGQNCHFCGKENAVCKCGDCSQFLCGECETKHKKMKMFKNHAILKLCQEHFDGISHICMKCVQAVCIKCIVLDHAYHENKVEEYQDGIDQLKDSLKETKIKLKERQNVIEKCQNELEIQQCEANNQRKELQRRRDALVKETEPIDHELLDLGETEIKFSGDVKMYKDLKEKFDVNCRNVDKLLESPDDQIVSNFSGQNTLAEKLLHETKKLNIKFKMNLTEEIKWPEKPELQNNFCSLRNIQIYCPTRIKAVGTDLFVYSDNYTRRFVVFDNKGAVIRSFEGLKEHGDVKCVGVHKNKLYLAQEKQIKCVSNFNTTQERSFTFMPKMKSLFKMAVVNDNILIYTDWGDTKVYEYNIEDNITKIVLQGLRNPTYISVEHTPLGTRYLLSLAPLLSTEGSVKIYNESWQLLTTITEGINYPCDTARCPGGVLLADWSSNKITLYSYTGDKVRTVLTEEDGLDYPISLTFKSPCIWIGQGRGLGDPGAIKCFRVV